MHRMLFEMARGNFNMQIVLSPHDDELEAIVVLLNMLAQELKESFLSTGYINPHETHRVLASATVIVDLQGTVVNATDSFVDILGLVAPEVIGRPFKGFIRDSSGQLAVLESLESDAEGAKGRTVSISLNAGSGLEVAAECTVERLGIGDLRAISFLMPCLHDEGAAMAPEGGKARKHPNTRRSDARLIQKVYDYILGHLDEPLPSIRELSRLFGTNEFKLKEGFRHFFHTSIYSFYTGERLKRSYLMIEQTDISLKSISLLNGFNSYPNFSKAFKKHFGFSPNELQRN